MTTAQNATLIILLIASAVMTVTSLLLLLRKVFPRSAPRGLPAAADRSGMNFGIAMTFILSIWCLRYAVGFYTILSVKDGQPTLTAAEEILNSLLHTLQTFSMDEDYTAYILDGKSMVAALGGTDAWIQNLYGMYSTLLNAAAPIAGGAVVFELLVSVFPTIKLFFSGLCVWREKYYFSELNKASLAMGKSIRANTGNRRLTRPLLIYTDAYVDDEEGKGSELMPEAKSIGAICVRDDLAHVRKSRLGSRKFLLIGEEEEGNLQALVSLADERNYKFLKKAEIFFFADSDAYLQIESRVRDCLSSDHGFTEKEIPSFIPILGYRNLISNLLTDIPLYAPLIGKQRDENGVVDLTVSILGAGRIGMEMFLSTYWFGQMLNCRLHIRVISNQTKEEFWDRIDYINPEIHRTTQKNDPILRINPRGDMADVYADVEYVQCDVLSSSFLRLLLNPEEGQRDLRESDYFFVSLGSDKENISVANTIRTYLGRHHIENHSKARAVVAYVVYDSDLADTLNRTTHYTYYGDKPDILSVAVGNLRDVYSVENVFMTRHSFHSGHMHQSYLSVQKQEDREKAHKKRINDDYKYWANLARSLHYGYDIFAAGFMDVSEFDYPSSTDPSYVAARDQAVSHYCQVLSAEIPLPEGWDEETFHTLLHRLSWAEHRRWNAFTRVKGFCGTACYDAYVPKTGSYKHMPLRLHPCLVECDQNGIRGQLDEKGHVVEDSLFQFTVDDSTDYLDRLTMDLYQKGLNSYDFKQYDYPVTDID
ncbi:MAG: hypothetical protein IJD38_01570 [Clostridia bacterium]|nr:hypothetical protein [Clostridia bacterium]